MDFQEIHLRVAYDLAHVCISWSVHTNKWHTTHNSLCGYYKFSFRIFIHFSWKDDSPLWRLCVSWCQIERAARLRLRLGNLLHLHAIRDSKTWNDSDKTSMTAGNYKKKFYNSLMTGKFFLFMASSFAWKTLIAFKMIAFSFDPHSPFDKPKTLNCI
jgi:hypothetical protein